MDKFDAIEELMREAHETAKSKGWCDDQSKYNFGQSIALMHSELSEALEEYRTGGLEKGIYTSICDNGKGAKPEGIAVEFADVIIRIFDVCAHHKLPLAAALCAKMKFNETRPYRHGGKEC